MDIAKIKKAVLWPLITLFLGATLYLNIREGKLGEFVIGSILISIISFIFIVLIPKQKAHEIAQYVGFTGFFIYMLLPKDAIYSRYLFIYGILLIMLSIFLKRDIAAKQGGRTLNEKIKNRLKITSVQKRMKLPKWVGGFVFPAFPFFHVVSDKWKGDMQKEAIIHENVHLYYLQNGWVVGVILAVIVLLSLLRMILPEGTDSKWITIFLFYLSAVFFEYVTFQKTHQLGQEMGIETRPWDKKILYKYLQVYAIWMGVILLIWEGLKFAWRFFIR